MDHFGAINADRDSDIETNKDVDDFIRKQHAIGLEVDTTTIR